VAATNFTPIQLYRSSTPAAGATKGQAIAFALIFGL
jgi:hypothetical protein